MHSDLNMIISFRRLNFQFLLFLFVYIVNATKKSVVPTTYEVPSKFSLKERFFSVPYPYILAGSAAAIEVYANLPQKVVHGSVPRPIPFPTPFKQDSLLIAFPGSGGPDIYTDLIIKSVQDQDKALGINRFAYAYDWLKWRGNFLRAAYDSESVGKQIGSQLADLSDSKKSLKSLHIIGISVGAFAANACCHTYKAECIKKGKNPTYVRLTLLDPFISKGIFRNSYGLQNFGISADYCESYLNSDDAVPFTNSPLPYGVTYDITNTKARNDFVPAGKNSLHCWPSKYYIILCKGINFIKVSVH